MTTNRAEEALRKSEHLNQKILNSTPNLIYIYDIEEQRNVYSNREIFDFLGYTQEQIAAMGSELFSNILHPDDAKAVDAHHARFINAPDNVTYDVEYRMKHANGEWRWLHSRDTLFSRNKEGLGKQILGICQDVTLTKQNEVTLKNSEEQYRAYTENSPVAFFVVNPEGKYIQVNDAATKLLLYSKKEFLKMSIVDILFEKDISFGLKQFATLRETGKSRFETALKRKDGEPVYVILNATLLPDGNMMAFCENITEYKRLNDELKLSEERLKLLFENAPDAYYLNDLKGNFLDGNKAAEEMIGYSRNELIGNSFLSLNVLPRNQILKAAKLLALNAIGKPTGPDEFILNRKNGTQISVEIRTHPLKIQGKKLVLGIARDISERKKAEEAIKFQADLLNQVGQAVIMVDNNRIIRFWNKAAEKLYGYSEEQALGHQVTELLGGASPEETDEVSSKLMAGESWSTETYS